MLAVDVVNACLKAVNACRKAGPIELKGNVSLNQLLLSEVLSDYFVKASSSFFAEKNSPISKCLSKEYQLSGKDQYS